MQQKNGGNRNYRKGGEVNTDAARAAASAAANQSRTQWAAGSTATECEDRIVLVLPKRLHLAVHHLHLGHLVERVCLYIMGDWVDSPPKNTHTHTQRQHATQ